MAFIYGKRLCDQRFQHGIEFRYTIPKGIRARDILANHERITEFLSIPNQQKHDSRSIKKLVLDYMSKPEQERREFLSSMAIPTVVIPMQQQPYSSPINAFRPKEITQSEDISLVALMDAYKAKYGGTWPKNTETHNDLAKQSWIVYFHETGITNATELTDETVQQFINWRHSHRHGTDKRIGPVSQKTITVEVHYFEGVIKLASRRESQFRLSSLGMFDKLVIPKTKKTVAPYEIEEMAKLLEFTRSTKSTWAEHLIVFLLNSGMRASEVDRMTREDWHWDEGVLVIGDPDRVSGNTKGKTDNSDRVIEITATMKQLFDTGLIFERGTQNTRDLLGTFFRRKRKEKIPVESPAIHRIRHTFASWLYRSGLKPLEEVSELLGHADLAFTKRQYSKKGTERASREKIRQKYKEAIEFYFEKYFSEFPQTVPAMRS